MTAEAHEVYIEVEHHGKYQDEGPKFLNADRFTYIEGQHPLVYVCHALRDLADAIDPTIICTNCGEPRSEHHMEREGEPNGLYRCLGPSGPITQHIWWQNNMERIDG